ncbi:MAG TPA: LPS export ABC transporter periplasmic protein LptC [Blastocatellia bacterium]|nr:LPS export ABC transporter periplasmic protein LptC [Blastocatellia bacterium]
MKRVRLLSAGRGAALGLFIAIAAALVVYLVFRSKHPQPEQIRPKLQGKVVAVFSNTHYSHEVGGQVRFNITAGTDRTYQDGTHELEQVKLESYGSAGERHDVVTCDRAKVSDPADLSKLDAEFISNVVVQTSEGLTLKTSYLHYDQAKNTVDTKEPVEFEGRNYAGRATGMIIEAPTERASLLKDVDVTIKPESEAVRVAKATDIATAGQQRDETPEERIARKARKRARKQQRRRAAESLAQAPAPEPAPAQRKADGEQRKQQRRRAAESIAQAPAPEPAPAQRKADAEQRKQQRRRAAESIAQAPAPEPAPAQRKADANQPAVKKPTRIRSVSALLEKKEHRVTFEGHAIVTQEADELRADRMVSYADASNHLERIEARGSAYLKQAEKAEIKSPDMDFFFGETHQLARAVALHGASTRSLGPEPLREASADTIEATFSQGAQSNAVEMITAQGNAVMKIHAPPPASNDANPAARELTADTVTMQFFPDGKNIKHAEAAGKAVMTVTPVRAERRADKKTIRSPRMDALFFEQGNRVKTFNATDGVRVEIEATIPEGHPLRATTSKSARADFLEDSQDIERVSQEGNFKYNEGDQNAVAERAVYDGQKEILNLRGKRPMVWDAKSRTQADEIDYDRQRDETHARGDVRTTYYSRETTNDSTPFKNTKSPIFVTAERADAQNKEGIAVYTMNARGWQDDNFIKADRIELYQDDKRMVATGNVESALYQTKQETSPGKREVVPGFATAERMTYSDTERKIHYEGRVKARQGTDRIEGSSVDVYLMQETNEVDHLNADGNVVLTQPGRRGVGDKLAYTSEDGRAVLTGKSARVDDVEKGATMGSQLTFYSRDDRISVENQQGTGRVRSTHRLTKSKQN